MKKLISFVLVACMMLATAALGESAIVVQNEQPPVLVTKVNAENQEFYATVHNAQAEMVAEVTDGSSIILTDVHHRTSVENAVIAARLTSAYEGVMEDVHHGDVTCELHDHAVKVDIDMVVASLEHDLDAYDLVMYEMFDVNFTDALGQLLTEDGYVELTLKLDAHQPLPIVVLYTKDGVNWTVIPYEKAGEQQISVRLAASGSLALLCDGTKVMGIGEEKEMLDLSDNENSEEDFDNGNFTPSVAGKLTPDLVVEYDENNEAYVGTIYDDQGEAKAKVPNRNYIWVTVTAERDYNHDVQTHEHLEWAFEGMKVVADVGELPSDSTDGTIAAEIDEMLVQMGLDLVHDQLIVKDLFEVSAYGDYLEYLYNEGYSLELTFTTELDPEMPVVVIHSADSVQWHVHPIEEATVHEDGTITLRMYNLGTVAILIENPNYQLNAEEMVTAP